MRQRKFSNHQMGIAVDLGSTTIAVCCIDMTTKEEILSFSFANPQTAYGTDIMTRIKHCITDKNKLILFRDIVLQELYKQLQDRLNEYISNIVQIVYSGNTTMLHILRGFDVKSLSEAPFVPVDISYYEEPSCLFNNAKDVFLSGFSAFVGADILSGAVYLNIGNKLSYDLLIDLGTNGEILLLNQNQGYATSTACGPVFDHAIKGAKYGSETIHAISNCLKNGLIDSFGTIQNPYFEKGLQIDKEFIIKQEHIRNFQLAKGAIFAGIQTIILEAGISIDEIEHVYLSGGFGFYMQIRDAFTVKLLPNALKNKIRISGNTSLEGAKLFLLCDNRELYLKQSNSMIERTKSIELANSHYFNEQYIQAMNF